MTVEHFEEDEEDEEDEEEVVEGGLDHALYDFPDMEARPTSKSSYTSQGAKKVNVSLGLGIAMFFILILVVSVTTANRKRNASTGEEERSSALALSGPPVASGDLLDLCKISSFEASSASLKEACIEECKLGVCCFADELKKVLSKDKEDKKETSKEIQALIGESYSGGSCAIEYRNACGGYESCKNILEFSEENVGDVEELATYQESQIPLADDKLERACSQRDLNECEAFCTDGECCRIFADEPCDDIFPTECLGYVPCDILDDKKEHDKDVLFIKELCTFEYVSTKEGRLQCSSVCQEAACCFDADLDCTPAMLQVCDDYGPCTILEIVAEAEYHKYTSSDSNDGNAHMDMLQQNLSSAISNACSKDSIAITEGRALCDELCAPAQCCFTNADCYAGSSTTEEMDAGAKSTFCLPYTKCAHFYSDNNQDVEEGSSTKQPQETEGTMKQQVDEICALQKMTSDLTKEACNAKCQDHICCVDPKEQFGCFTEDDEKYCNDYTSCSSLFQDAATSTSTSTEKQDDDYHDDGLINSKPPPATEEQEDELTINNEAFTHVQQTFEDQEFNETKDVENTNTTDQKEEENDVTNDDPKHIDEETTNSNTEVEGTIQEKVDLEIQEIKEELDKDRQDLLDEKQEQQKIQEESEEELDNAEEFYDLETEDENYYYDYSSNDNNDVPPGENESPENDDQAP